MIFATIRGLTHRLHHSQLFIGETDPIVTTISEPLHSASTQEELYGDIYQALRQL